MFKKAPRIRKLIAGLCFDGLFHLALGLLSIPLCLVIPFMLASRVKPAQPNEPNVWQAVVSGFTALFLFFATLLFKMFILNRAYGWSVREMLADSRRRDKAEQIIHESTPSDAVSLLMKGIKSHENAKVRATCIYLLTPYELDLESLSTVKASLGDPDAEVRNAAKSFFSARRLQI